MDQPLDLSLKSKEDEVEVLGEYYPALRHVRVMYNVEVLALLQSQHGCLARKFFCVTVESKDTFKLLPGTGVQLYLSGPEPERLYFFGDSGATELHAVLLYRGQDGDYCFFDSNFYRSPSEEVLEAARRSGPGRMYWCYLKYGIQGVNMRSCQYYCVAFMTFVARHSDLPTERLIEAFRQSMALQADEMAVRLTQEAFDDAHLVVDFHMTAEDFPLQGLDSLESRTGQEPRVISKYFAGLTQAQVSTLLANVTVLVASE